MMYFLGRLLEGSTAHADPLPFSLQSDSVSNPMNILLKIAFFSIAAAIVILSLLPVEAMGPDLSDKLKHAGAYAALSLSAAAAFLSKPRFKWLLFIIALCVVFGAILEVLQSLTGRNPEFLDLSADAGGASVGAAAGAFIIRLRNKIQGGGSETNNE